MSDRQYRILGKLYLLLALVSFGLAFLLALTYAVVAPSRLADQLLPWVAGLSLPLVPVLVLNWHQAFH